jgi:threonine/homoserine/homoserine lactone efflux protein
MDLADFALFFVAALAIAMSPGPGIFYVAARTLAGGRDEGLASSIGTGVAAIVLASAEAFAILKIAGAVYLVWVGVKTMREAGREARIDLDMHVNSTGAARAFREGIVVEALNPKTAVFFLAFLPQFVDPADGPVWLQFLLLGLVSVILNTAVDVVVAVVASRARSMAVARPSLLRRLRQSAGLAIASLGLALLFARRPASL